MNRVLCSLPLIIFCTSISPAQLNWGGEMSVYLLKSARTTSPRAVNNGDATFGWRGDFLFDAAVSDQISGFCTIRVLENQYINFDALAVRITDIASLGLNLQVGKFDLPFGNLAERRFPRRNPLYSVPLIYDYSMSLPNYAPTQYDLLRNRGLGLGMRLLDRGMYDVGVEVFGTAGILSYAVAVSNGMISANSYNTLNTNGDFGKLIRLAVTPTTGLTLGTAFSWGAYLENSGQYAARTFDPAKYLQRIGEVDLEFSAGHAVIFGEAVYSTYRVPFTHDDADLSVTGYYGEAKYTLIPRLYVAVRVNGLIFSKVTDDLVSEPWDYNVTEVEGGLGFFLDRDVLLKLVRRETHTDGGSKPKDNLTVAQLVVAF